MIMWLCQMQASWPELVSVMATASSTVLSSLPNRRTLIIRVRRPWLASVITMWFARTPSLSVLPMPEEKRWLATETSSCRAFAFHTTWRLAITVSSGMVRRSLVSVLSTIMRRSLRMCWCRERLIWERFPSYWVERTSKRIFLLIVSCHTNWAVPSRA